MKRSIEWYENNLKHRLDHYEREKLRMEEIQRSIDRNVIEIAFLERQITTAKAEGKDGFDADKYLVKRKGEK